MLLIALVVAALLVVAFALLTRGRRRPAVSSDVQSMRLTLERKVREGADFRF